jgi:DNA-directed RNA polymerase specialized sigma24 family protein
MLEPETIDWQMLLKAAKRGDQRQLSELFEALHVRLWIIIQYKCWGWSIEDQEDLLQETLKVFLEKIDGISDRPDLFALKILKNKIGDELRKRLGRRKIFPDDDDDTQAPLIVPLDESLLSEESYDIEREIENKEIIDNFKHSIKKLSTFCKTFFLGLLEGKSINDMWEFFSSLDPKLKRSAFDTRNLRCRQKLTAELKKYANVRKGNSK